MKFVLDKLIIRNFRSFGDLDEEGTYHEICLNNCGPVLITGEVDKLDNKSNGAGKTSIIEAIIWCLFGRLSNIHNPSNKIVNWVAGKNCMVKIQTVDGYEICRTRNFEGHSDLLISRHGAQVEGGDATNANAQATLNSLFGLDFHTFISSVFFGQSSGSFLSLSDIKKKAIVENLFGLTKLSYYAQVAKEKIGECEKLYKSIKKKIEESDASIASLSSEIENFNKLSEKFEADRTKKIQEHELHIESLMGSREDRVDLDMLGATWDLINKSNNKLRELENKKEAFDKDLRKVVDREATLLKSKIYYAEAESAARRIIDNISDKIKRWEKARNKICPTCEQMVPDKLIDEKIEGVKRQNQEELESANDKLSSATTTLADITNKLKMSVRAKKLLERKIEELVDKIKKLKKSTQKLISNNMTLLEAKKHNEIVDNTDNEAKRYRVLMEEEEDKENNYIIMIQRCKVSINQHELQKKKFQEECNKIGREASHLTFIYRAHSDKLKIRSFLISGSVPILNNRLSYYFNELEMDSDIHFNNALQIKSDRWPYEYHSGGEKKRVDLALMCALYDTFVAMHGQQTNILVLDEIDKELDKSGVDEYVGLIVDDLSTRIGTILVISHKNEINYAFPSQIKVKKEGDISYLE